MPNEREYLKKISEELVNQNKQRQEELNDVEEQLKITGKAMFDAIAHGNSLAQKTIQADREQLKLQKEQLEADLATAKQLAAAENQLAMLQDGNNIFGRIAETLNVIREGQLSQLIRMPTLGDLKEQAERAKDLSIKSFEALKSLPGKIGESIKNIPGFKALGDAMSSIGSIIKTGLMLAGAAIGFQGFLNGWQKALDWFGANASFGEKLASGLAGLVGIFTGLNEESMKELATKLAGFFDWIWEHVTGLFEGVFGGIKTIIDGIFDKDTGKVWDGMAQIVKAIANSVLNLAEDVLGFFAGEGLAATVIGGLRSFTNGIIDFVHELGPVVATAFSETFGNIADAVGGIWTVVTGVLDGNVEQIKQGFSDVFGAVKNQISTIITYIEGLFGAAGMDFTVEGLIGSGLDFVQRIADAVTGSMTDVANFVVDGVKGGMKAAVDTVSNVFDSLMNSIIDTLNFFIDKINAGIGSLPFVDDNIQVIDRLTRAQSATANIEGVQAAQAENTALVAESQAQSSNNGAAVQANTFFQQDNRASNINVAGRPSTKAGAAAAYIH